MKKTIWIGAVVLVGLLAQGATNDLATALQKGLFEEEANRNLDAAIQAYQSVANQFDKDRKLAATAIFRLGECYRKQGNTNGAATQFERIVREFSDQSALVTLSRQNLASFGAVATAPAAGSSTQNPVDQATEAEEVKRLQALVKDSPDLLNAPDAASGMTPLDRAAEAGQLEVAQFLLANGADTEARATRWQGRTALHFAAARGQRAMVELLLSNRANAQATTEDGLTPLHLAVEKGYRSVAEYLLEHGAKVDAADSRGTTPLLMAAAHGFKAVIELLLAHGADINATTSSVQVLSPTQGTYCGTALEIAAQRHDQALVEFLVAKGAEVNRVDPGGRTALSYVAEQPDEPMVKLLLAAHADPNAGTLDLPLARAAYTGDIPMLKLLLGAGADPNTNSRVTWSVTIGSFTYSSGAGPTVSPLFLAVTKHHAEAVTALLHAKADPNSTGPEGQALVFEALSDPSTLKALLESGANPNVLSANRSTPLPGQPQLQRETPLQRAANLDSAHAEEVVGLLLAHGANPNVSFSNGWTPLHEATRRGDTNVMALLLQKGVAVNARQLDGYTPLHVAIELGRPEAVKLLLDNKADPNARDNGGQTLLDYAKSRVSQPPGSPSVPTPVGLPRGLPRPLRVAPKPAVLPGGGTAGTTISPESESDRAALIVDLLRQYGALDDLPRLDAIELRRPSIHFQQTLFAKDADNRNRFTLSELVGVEYALLAGSPEGDPDWRASYPRLAMDRFNQVLAYPDLAHMRVRKPAQDSKGWQERTVDLSSWVNSGICTNDISLSWGEVVEVPEQDHPIGKPWYGFTAPQIQNLVKGLQRQVELVVNGHTAQVSLGPLIASPGALTYFGPGLSAPEVKKGTLWLKPALLNSGLVLASSDLSRVKLTRRDPATGARQTWVYDCASANPEVWLQEGDVIEVPEKAQGSGAPPPQANR